MTATRVTLEANRQQLPHEAVEYVRIVDVNGVEFTIYANHRGGLIVSLPIAHSLGSDIAVVPTAGTGSFHVKAIAR